jgi:hypothetical protein
MKIKKKEWFKKYFTTSKVWKKDTSIFGKVYQELFNFGLSIKMMTKKTQKFNNLWSKSFKNLKNSNWQQLCKFYYPGIIMLIPMSEKQFKLFCLNWLVSTPGKVLGGFFTFYILKRRNQKKTRIISKLIKKIRKKNLQEGILRKKFLIKLLNRIKMSHCKF